MCYETSLTKTEKQIQKTYQAIMKVPLLYEPYYHQSAYVYPEMYCIPAESPTEILPMEWGLVPHYEKNVEKFRGKKYSTWNARAETLLTSSMYSNPTRKRRCLILADGFFEPHYESSVQGAIPYYCHLEDRKLFAFAGIYNEIKPDYYTVSLVTTQANDTFKFIHNKKKDPAARRMPLVLDPDYEFAWLETDLTDKEIEELLAVSFIREPILNHPVTQDMYKRDINTNTPKILEKVDFPYLHN